MSAISLLALNLGAVLLLFSVLWGLAQFNRDPSFIDAFWAFSIGLIAVLTFVLSSGATGRHMLLAGLATLWAVRLGLYLFLRWRHEGADRRYMKLLSNVREKRGWSYAHTTAVFVFLPQAVLVWLTSLPVQLGQVFAAETAIGVLGYAGAALALFGIGYETLADAQLSRFKHDPSNAGRVLDTGLWAWSRHPNYFGEICVWWGLWLVAAETGWGALALPGPVFVTFTLLKLSGVTLQEANIADRRPDYARYKTKTSALLPRPPKSDN